MNGMIDEILKSICIIARFIYRNDVIKGVVPAFIYDDIIQDL